MPELLVTLPPPSEARLFMLLLFRLLLPNPPKAGVDIVVVSCGRGTCGCVTPGGGARLKLEKALLEAPPVLLLAPGGGGSEKDGACWL